MDKAGATKLIILSIVLAESEGRNNATWFYDFSCKNNNNNTESFGIVGLKVKVKIPWWIIT